MYMLHTDASELATQVETALVALACSMIAQIAPESLLYPGGYRPDMNHSVLLAGARGSESGCAVYIRRCL